MSSHVGMSRDLVAYAQRASHAVVKMKPLRHAGQARKTGLVEIYLFTTLVLWGFRVQSQGLIRRPQNLRK